MSPLRSHVRSRAIRWAVMGMLLLSIALGTLAWAVGAALPIRLWVSEADAEGGPDVPVTRDPDVNPGFRATGWDDSPDWAVSRLRAPVRRLLHSLRLGRFAPVYEYRESGLRIDVDGQLWREILSRDGAELQLDAIDFVGTWSHVDAAGVVSRLIIGRDGTATGPAERLRWTALGRHVGVGFSRSSASPTAQVAVDERVAMEQWNWAFTAELTPDGMGYTGRDRLNRRVHGTRVK